MSGPSQPFSLESFFGGQAGSGQVTQGQAQTDTPSEQLSSSKRGKTGCITCRLRKKRCDEAKPICATCSRLGIECMGYGLKRPKWLKENDNAKKAKQNIKQIVLQKRSSRNRQGSSADSEKNASQDVADSSLSGLAKENASQETDTSLDAMDIDIRTDNIDLNQQSQPQARAQNQSRDQVQPQQPQPHFWELGSMATNASASSSSSNNDPLGWNISPTTTTATTASSTHNDLFGQPTSASSSSTTTNMFGNAIPATSADTLYPGFLPDPSLFPPPAMSTLSNGPSDIGALIPSIPGVNDISMDALWGILFGPQPPPEFTLDQNGSHYNPNENSNPFTDLNPYNNNNNNNDNNNNNTAMDNTQQTDADISSMINSDTPIFQMPSPTSGISNGLSPLGTSTSSPNLAYLHHYLNVVLPLQYRIMGISISMGDFVAPLALQRNEVLTSVSSLAALHMVAQRTKRRPHNLSRLTVFDAYSTSSISNISKRDKKSQATLIEIEREILNETSTNDPNTMVETSDDDDAEDDDDNDDDDDADARVASISHQRTMERLRFISPQDLTAEEIIVSVLFAVSYHLFCGGTSKHLKELLPISQRCLSAALYSSPELAISHTTSKAKTKNNPSPWSRYRILIEHMIWIDILASVTQNKASPLLPVYRKLLDHLPYNSNADPMGTKTTNGTKPLLLMDRLMGCDSTTLLAMAETIALSEWKDRAESAGYLSYKEFLDRAGNVEKILNERAWRESHLDRPTNADEEAEDSTSMLRRVMSDVFHGSVKVLLAVTVNGPFPRVPEIAAAVGETMEALTRLDIQHPNVQIHRAVVLPITIAGCHCETVQQQSFFRECFQCLGPEARAFGNTGPALELMEEVWRRRAAGQVNVKVDWRQTMYDLGWEAGILLI
ncbi:uncharacterized protein I303_101874 [Kwoniella dejecticola CBS 10117]|uniref:Zn(2)-C6 fungal-type domain-containing protein n=1 Tax=Kwoniella dejecticola CBS 10117 TaxID=1296121 RepID=A0AAJ8KJ43_9TREE